MWWSTWWPWNRSRGQPTWRPPGRIPDGDTVLGPGQRRWADLLPKPDGRKAPPVPRRPEVGYGGE